MTAANIADWIRSWYPGGPEAHLSPTCPELLRVEAQPREGAGWLNPNTSDTCQPCLDRYGYASWHAECKTCRTCLCDDFTARPYVSEADAKNWRDEHECQPEVVVEAPPEPAPPAQPDNQTALIPLADLTAERTAA